MIPVQASESEPLFSSLRLSLTSSVNSQTKTSKVRDDKLEAAITSPRLRRMKAVSSTYRLEEREHCALVE
jgi:hypothetical protein